MKTRFLFILHTSTFILFLTAPVNAQTTNTWNSGGDGQWETAANWSVGAPSDSDAANLVTNATTKTVTVDATTVLSNAVNDCLTISNLTVSAPAGAINTLQLTNSGAVTPLRILNAATINSGGAVLVTNSTVRVEGGALNIDAATANASLTVQPSGTVAVVGPVTIGGGLNSTGLVVVTGDSPIIGFPVRGLLVVTNRPDLVVAAGFGGFIIDGSVVLNNGGSIINSNADSTNIGGAGSGSLTMNGGLLISRNLVMRHNFGEMKMAGGTNIVNEILAIGQFSSTGEVWMTGGLLVATNAAVIGEVNGVGQMTISNGTVLFRGVTVGQNTAGVGTLTIAGGTTMISGVFPELKIGDAHPTSTGAVWVTGGLLSNDGTIQVGGASGHGQMTVSNGTVLCRSVFVGTSCGAKGGVLTIAGGTSSIFSNLTLGCGQACSGVVTGVVNIVGGELDVTNSLGNATLHVRNGTVTLSSGTLRVDQIVMTNSCAIFTRTGGTLIYGTAVLDPARDDDGDGLPNGWEQGYGLDPLDNTGINGASGDFDGDGFTNLQEFQNSTDPTGRITTQPQSQTVLPSSNVTFTVVAAGSGTLNYQWRFNGTNISGATGSSYTRPSAQFSDAGNYSVIVSNDLVGTLISSNAFLTVLCAPPGTLAWWPGENNVNDIIGTNNGTLQGGTGYASGKRGQGFLFVDGSAGGVNLGNVSAFNFETNSSFSIAAWFNTLGKPVGGNDGQMIVALNYNCTPQLQLLAVEGDGALVGTVYFAIRDAGNVVELVRTPSAVPSNQFHYVVGTREVNGTTKTLRLYLDGVLVDTKADPTTGSLVSSGNDWIGRRNTCGTDSVFHGVIDEVAIFNRALSASEISAIYYTGSGGLCQAVDLDGNGLPDAWEQQYFGQTGVDPNADPDGDGVTNLQEFQAGTDPTNPNSSPNINSWTNSVSGKWETGTNWVLTIPPASNQAVFVTNALTKTVTIDATTTNTASAMTISNLVVSGSVNTTNTLFLNNAGTNTPLVVLQDLTVGTNGVLLITNSVLQQLSRLIVDGGAVVLNTGSIINTNTFSFSLIGDTGPGQMTVSNGTWLSRSLSVGSGTLTLAGGTIVPFGLGIGNFLSTTGAVWVTGGQLLVTNASLTISTTGVGQMTVSNGTVLAPAVTVASGLHSHGTLTIAGGTFTVSASSIMSVGGGSGSTGAVWVTGGQLTTTNGLVYIGVSGISQMAVSNGTWLAKDVWVGAGGVPLCPLTIAGGTNTLSSIIVVNGTLTVAGGTSSVFSNITIGFSQCIFTQTVVVAGGNLFVTNATASAVLDVRSGTLTQSGGTLVIDNLVITNACGRFLKTGGTLSITTTNLSANLDADGDGLPNSWETSYGLSPFSDVGNDGASGDPDGDGVTNLQEFQAGTDASNNASAFRITAIAKESNDIRVTWMTGPGKTNALERTAGDANGSCSNNFAAIFTVTNTVGNSTNYLDVGGATNVPSLYYRIRLVP